jgi:thiamine-phosphate pyrophosphorylase
MLRSSGLYAITDDTLLAGRLVTSVQAVLAGGCRILQYRSKQANTGRQLDEASQLLTLCQQHGATLLVNDNVQLAAQMGAHGVHLGQEDMPVQAARAALGNRAIIGVTCHDSITLALQAQAAGADYVAFGRFFTSGTKQSAPPAHLSVLHEARRQLHIPVVAIGGITLDNAPSVLAAGADILAVVGDVFSHHNITARAQAYQALFTDTAPRRLSRDNTE